MERVKYAQYKHSYALQINIQHFGFRLELVYLMIVLLTTFLLSLSL